jgi:hypothetical protein
MFSCHLRRIHAAGRCCLYPAFFLLLRFGSSTDTDPAGQIRGENALRIKPLLDCQKLTVAGIDTGELLGGEDLVFGEMDLATPFDRCFDQAVDGLAAGGLVTLLGVELEVEAVAVLGEREQSVIGFVSPEDRGYRRAGRRLADPELRS